MATTITEKIKVNKLTKYGFQVGDEFVNYSKLFKDQAKVVPGIEFDAELYVADSGKRYLNKILSSVTAASPAQVLAAEVVTKTVTPVDTDKAKKFVPKFEKKATADTSMSKAEWQAKDRSQLIGGLSHDAAAVTAAMLTFQSFNTEDVLKCYQQVLEGMLKIREGLK